MIRVFLLGLCLLAALSVESAASVLQSDTIPLIHSGKVLQEALALQQEQKYAEAIQKFLSIPESDTNYVQMRAELIVSYLDNKDYDKAIALAEDALKERNDYTSRFYIALGNAYSGKGDKDKALEVYEKALKRYPNEYLLHYNKGVALVHKKEFPQAIEALQRAITINPFYANSHLFLGDAMIFQGKKSRAMMSLGMYLALVPDNNAALVLLNNLMKNSVTYENSAPAEETLASFKQLDLLIRSDAALDKKFKSSVAFKAPVAQQLELMLEALPAEEKSDDFWMQFYVPLYAQVNQQGLKETFIYHVLSSVDDKGVKRWLGSNKKNLEKFFGLANQQLKTFRYEHTATVGGQKALYTHWFYDNHKLNAIGNQKDENTYTGPWVFYHPNGELKAEGAFTQEGKKTGKWSYYYANGVLKKQEEYDSGGEVTGLLKDFYDTGLLQNEIPYKAGKIDGLVKIYYPCGQLKEELLYKDDQRQGEGKTYYLTGQLSSRYAYKDNEPLGAFTYFYKNGKKKEVYTYASGKLNGAYEFYHKNGKLAQQGQYTNGEMTGEWQGFHEDGKKKFTGSYAAGLKTGTWYNYNADGSMLSEESYDGKGTIHGKARYFTEEGKLYYEYDYKAGLLVGYKYYGLDGKVLSEAADGKGNFKIKAFYPEGTLRYEGTFKKGKGNGTFTYYHATGLKSSVIEFRDDAYHGRYQTFYESGQKNIVSTYVEGQMHGYYRQFHKNGRVKTEGWVLDDEMEQRWHTYLPDGTVSHKQYFLFGELHGTYEQADYKGRPYVKSKYYFGKLVHSSQYDTLGTVIHTAGLEMGTGKNTLYYANKKPRYDTQLQCGETVADLKSYFKNGKIYAITPLKNGEYNGRYQAFYPNLKVKTEGDYVDNEQSGLWTWYFESGKIDSKIPLKEGKADGERLDYYENGQVRVKATYKNGDKAGSSFFYAPDGTLQIEKVYDSKGMVSYRYLDKNNALTALILLPNYAGPVKAYYPNGNVSVEQQYKNSYLDGKQVTYYPTGKIMEVRLLKDGVEEGVREEYFPDGKMRKSTPYQDNDLHGQEIEYHANGKVKRKTSYLFGEKEGWELLYDQTGKLLKKEYYRYGYVY